MDKTKRGIFIVLFLILFLSTSVAATRYVNYDFKEGLISSSGEFTATTNPVTNVNAIGVVCADDNCANIDGVLWDGQVQNSGASDSMQLTYPTTLQSSYGYGIYYYKPGYIGWESTADWWGTTGSDPQGPYTKYLSKKQDCYSPIDTFSVTNNAQANIPLVIDVSASLDATTYAALRNSGPLDYTPPSLLNDYYSVATRIILTIYDPSGNVVNQQTQDAVIPFSGSQRVQFTWTPTLTGNYTAAIATTVTDAKCSSSIEQSSSKQFTVIPEQPRNMCYTILNNLATSDQFPTDNETITITATKISNYADNNYALAPVPTNATLKITRIADSQIVNQQSQTINANINNYDSVSFSFSWPINSGTGNYNISINGIANSASCSGLQNLQDSASEIIYVNAKPNQAPTITNIPDASFNEDSTPPANLIDLWQYASDPESNVSQLTYIIVSQSNPSLVNCSVTSNRYVNCGQPALHTYGFSAITVEVSDGQYSDRDTFNADVLPINYAPTIDFLTSSPTLLRGGNTVTLTPANPDDVEQSQLYFYCSESTSEPTSSSNICDEGNAAYTYPYSGMMCAYATSTDTAAHTAYCRVYDGTAYSQTLQASYATDSTAPILSNGQPTGTITTNTPVLDITSNENAACRGTIDLDESYSDMDFAFTGAATAHTYLTTVLSDAIHTVYARCQDNVGNIMSSSYSWSFIVNATPVANANGPYAGFEGSPIAFTALAYGGVPPYTFEWDLNNDGNYETPGQNPTYTWNDDFSSTIVLRVTDSENHSTTNQTTVTISNVAPTANANGAYYCNVSQAITLAGTATDPGADTLTYAWDLNDDSTFETSGQNATYSCTANGTFNVNLRVTDDDGGIGYASATVVVSILSPSIPTPPSPALAAPKLEDELYVSRISFDNNYALSPYDDVAATITIKNTGDTKLEDNTITLTIPDLGLRKRVGPFDLNKGESATRKVSLNLEGAAPGWYYARIVISNDKVTRIKHRDITIR